MHCQFPRWTDPAPIDVNTWLKPYILSYSFDKSINDQEEDKDNPPKVRIEGPFGGGNQDWYKFEVAVMVGGGIGVTPYASILNDLVFGTSTNRYSGVACKKVYFLWICPSHRYFEWFIDVLRDVERKDVTNVLEMHIFITQFFHKFDLRTTMLVSKMQDHLLHWCRFYQSIFWLATDIRTLKSPIYSGFKKDLDNAFELSYTIKRLLDTMLH